MHIEKPCLPVGLFFFLQQPFSLSKACTAFGRGSYGLLLLLDTKGGERLAIL